jgi:hypothetical protein
MYQVLLNSELVYNFLLSQDRKNKSESSKLWKILQSSKEDKYTGYISETEWSKLCFCVQHIFEKYCGDAAKADEMLSHCAKVLNIGQPDESNSFVYVISENIISFDSSSRSVSVEQFLMRYEAEKMLNLRYEEGESEPIFDLESNSLTTIEESNIISREADNLLNSYDTDKDYLSSGLGTDSLTGIGENDIIVGEIDNLLFDASTTDSFTEIGENDIIAGEIDNLLFGASTTDSFTEIGENDIIAGEIDNLLFGSDSNAI